MADLQEGNNISNRTNIILFILGVLFFSYTCIRASLLSITYDEAFVYLDYVRNRLYYSGETNPVNIQLLNNFLTILSTKLFQANEFVIRIPNLLAHILFLVYSAKLLKGFKGDLLIISSFIILNLNPYMLDFFSLARQYGLSMGLMMTSVYYLYQYNLHRDKTKFAIVSMIFAGLTVFASLVMLNFFLAVFGAIILLMFCSTLRSTDSRTKSVIVFLKKASIPTLIILLVLGFMIPKALELKEAKELFFGENNGFLWDTLRTAVFATTYNQPFQYKIFVLLPSIFVLLVLCFTAIFLVFKAIKKETTVSAVFLSILFFLLIICAFSIIVQHHLFDTKYLIYRTTLFFIVLFNLLLIFLINELGKQWKKAFAATHVISALLIIHFFTSFKMERVMEWKEDAETKIILSDLEQLKNKSLLPRPIMLETSLLLQPGINFYRDIRDLKWLNHVGGKRTNSMLNDYFLLTPDDLAEMNKDSLEIIKTYPETHLVLARPKFLQKESTLFCEEQTFKEFPEHAFHLTKEMEYGKGFVIELNDSIDIKSPGIITFSANVMSKETEHSNVIIVVCLGNKNGDYLWERGFVKDHINKEGEWTQTSFSCFVPGKIQPGDVLKAYIWNPERHEMHFRSMKICWTKKAY